jgi:hypothetical protein
VRAAPDEEQPAARRARRAPEAAVRSAVAEEEGGAAAAEAPFTISADKDGSVLAPPALAPPLPPLAPQLLPPLPPALPLPPLRRQHRSCHRRRSPALATLVVRRARRVWGAKARLRSRRPSSRALLACAAGVRRVQRRGHVTPGAALLRGALLRWHVSNWRTRKHAFPPPPPRAAPSPPAAGASSS